MVLEPQDRAEVVRIAVQAFHGKLHSFFLCFGQYDGMAITEFPDDVTAMACMMSTAGEGGLEAINTTSLLSMEDGQRAMRLANEVVSGYRPPSGSTWNFPFARDRAACIAERPNWMTSGHEAAAISRRLCSGARRVAGPGAQRQTASIAVRSSAGDSIRFGCRLHSQPFPARHSSRPILQASPPASAIFSSKTGGRGRAAWGRCTIASTLLSCGPTNASVRAPSLGRRGELSPSTPRCPHRLFSSAWRGTDAGAIRPTALPRPGSPS